MLDLVLKSQGLQPVVNVKEAKAPVKILTRFAYLTPDKFKIACFIKDNPSSSSKEISEGTGIGSDSMYSFLRNMFCDRVVSRTGTFAQNKPNYFYTIALGAFKINTGIKKLSKKESKAISCVTDLGKCSSTDIVNNTKINKANIYYLMRILVEKGMLEIDSFNRCLYFYQVTAKGKQAIIDGGHYEG